MQPLQSLRRNFTHPAAWLLLAAGPTLMHAQTLPAMPPTSAPSQAPAGAAASTPPPARHAQVIFANGQLQVRADNSSLNQILRSISHQTGLKITGGVADQRVFGSYGPAPMSTVLATLLDGTGTNILLLGGDAKTPPELILTQANGGPEPPGPNSPAYAMYDDATDRNPAVPPPSAHAATPPPQPAARPVVTPQPSMTPAPAVSAATPTPPGKLTPEMVMQQLLQMQKQQEQRKRELDQTIQKEQEEQSRKLHNKPTTTSQPPAGSTPQ